MKTIDENKSFSLFYDWYETFQDANDAKFRKIIDAIYRYYRYNEDFGDKFDGDLKMLMRSVMAQIKRFEEKSRRNREYALRGAELRRKRNEASQTSPDDNVDPQKGTDRR